MKAEVFSDTSVEASVPVEDVLMFVQVVCRMMNYQAYAAVHDPASGEDLVHSWVTRDRLPPKGCSAQFIKHCQDNAFAKLNELSDELDKLEAEARAGTPQISRLKGGIFLESFMIGIGGLCEDRNRFAGALGAWWRVHGLELTEGLERVVLLHKESARVIRIAIEDQDAFADFMIESGIMPGEFTNRQGEKEKGFFIQTNDPSLPTFGVAFAS